MIDEWEQEWICGTGEREIQVVHEDRYELYRCVCTRKKISPPSRYFMLMTNYTTPINDYCNTTVK